MLPAYTQAQGWLALLISLTSQSTQSMFVKRDVADANYDTEIQVHNSRLGPVCAFELLAQFSGGSLNRVQ